MRNEQVSAGGDAFRDSAVAGEFLEFDGERYYVIRNVDRMAPFFISVISSSDHWLFASSTGGLTAGRVSPDTALFPYVTVDRVHESTPHTGAKTILRTGDGSVWEPFSNDRDGHYRITRNLYKNVLGSKICFEEINHDLQLAFRHTWMTSDEFGFARQCELRNLSKIPAAVDLIDGLQNLLPAGTPSYTQANSSNLVDAYKWSELDEGTGLALFTLYSGISDRAEPSESLRANTVFCLGLEQPVTLISSTQLDAFRRGATVSQETHKRGVRGAYFVNAQLELGPQAAQQWTLVADIEKTQGDVAALRHRLERPDALANAIEDSIRDGSERLARIVAAADGFQLAAEENVTVHHYANVLFNVLRGGIFDDQYRISARDLRRTLAHFNRRVFDRNRQMLDALPEQVDIRTLLLLANQTGDEQLERLCFEYLPITFGRRHGDPSRPWNRFSIRLKDQNGDPLLSYEGNWRDIFQNWEALAFSYPEFIENVIAKFVNASTMDGFNPYRITKEGIDWEIEDPADPWSYIGYWGDHQIIYLLKLLELSNHFHPAKLSALLHKPIFSYANVPYRIKPFDAILENPKSTVEFDHDLEALVAQRVADIGADGKLVMDATGDVYQVNLLEKLLVPLLSKLGNLVPDGGIWLNTQRPEWNDANNALVGQGLSMVTLCYMRRYVSFLQDFLSSETGKTDISAEVSDWIGKTIAALGDVHPLLSGPISPEQRFAILNRLGTIASEYRAQVYRQDAFSGCTECSLDDIRQLLSSALEIIDHSIRANVRPDRLYHAYNLLDIDKDNAGVGRLYLMLEGQVAALSSGAIGAEDAMNMLSALFDSDVYRPDQKTFMLYPDRKLPGFMAKNRIPDERVTEIGLLVRMLEAGDTRLVYRDLDGNCRFNADFRNIADLDTRLSQVTADFAAEVERDRAALRTLYEDVFNHRAFTGRSGGMFGFEGLGCIYWHMVSKLLLAVQEIFFASLGHDSDRATTDALGKMYYRVREGIGFNKTPADYGAFPTDPYSHTPKHAGAQQPGMTGQVKEEVLTRFGELGIRVEGGKVRFSPDLLRQQELISKPAQFCFLDVDGHWQDIAVPADGLAFTWCQVPIVYVLDDKKDEQVVLTMDDGKRVVLGTLHIDSELSLELFQRSGRVRRINVSLHRRRLMND